MSSKSKIIVFILAFLLPQVAWANAGSGMFLNLWFHLFISNLFLGLIEGIVLILLNRGKVKSAILWLIASNYISWSIGTFVIIFLQEYVLDSMFDLSGVFTVWVISIALLFVLIVIVKFPFYYSAFWRDYRDKWTIAKQDFIINLFTFAAMMSLYLLSGNIGYMTNLDVNQSLLSKDFNYELYVLNENKVLKATLEPEFNPETIKNYSDSLSHEYKFFFKSDSLANNFDFVLASYNKDAKHYVVEEEFMECSDISYWNYSKNHGIFRAKTDFRGINNKKALIEQFSSWAFSISNSDGVKTKVSFCVPWIVWKIEEITFLNNQEILFLIGGRLVLMNIETKEIAYITRADSYAVRKLK